MTERPRAREIDDDEGQRLAREIRASDEAARVGALLAIRGEGVG